jgi:REP element-mobilizing transposase RayT
MARRPRDTAPGLFHVHAHCVWAASELFRDDEDRMRFLRELVRAGAKAEWACIEYCLMRSHYHLLLDVGDGALPKGMHLLNFRYASAFNRRHAMKGHAMAWRYRSKRIVDDTHLLGTFRYIARNPVEAGLCERSEDWPWSSYSAAVGLTAPISFVDPQRVIGCLGGSRDLAIAELRGFVKTP